MKPEHAVEEIAALQDALAVIGVTPIEHRFFVETLAALRALDPLRSIALFLGVTGVGKTVLLETFVRALRAQWPSDGLRVVAAFVPARTARSGPFSFRGFWPKVEAAIGEPLPDRRCALPAPDSDTKRLRTSATEYQLRESAIGALRRRGVRYLVVDEALAIAGTGGGAWREQLDKIREFADDAGCQLVLACTPRIVPVLKLSGELTRRRVPLVYPRYRCKGPSATADLRHFHEAMTRLVEPIPPLLRPSMDKALLRLFLEGTFGCVGFAAQWLRDAVSLRISLARTGQRPELVIEDLLATAITDEDVRTVGAEIHDGEVELDKAMSRSVVGATLRSAAEAAKRRAAEEGSDAPKRKKARGRARPKGIHTPKVAEQLPRRIATKT